MNTITVDELYKALAQARKAGLGSKKILLSPRMSRASALAMGGLPVCCLMALPRRRQKGIM